MSHLRLAVTPIATEDRSVRVSTAAAMLDCDDSTVRKLAKDGELEWHRLGRRGVRIYLSSIEEYRIRMTAPTPAERRQTRKARQAPSKRHAESMAFLHSLGVLP